MSALRLPRLIFSGKFQADVSTVNNDPEHFDAAHFQPDYQLPQTQNAANGWWNPNGTGAWKFDQCVITRVFYKNGQTCDDPSVDPIVGTSIASNPTTTTARLVDLDSENQIVSSIWGMTVVAGKPGSLGFSAPFAVAAFQDMNTRAPTAGPGSDIAAGAGWQSVLSPVNWLGATGSRFLSELAENGPPAALSMKFNVDGYSMDSSSAQFTFGRVVGSIAPAAAAEPARFVAGRALDPAAGASLNSAYVEIADQLLTIDLGNSLPTVQPGGPLSDVGALDLAIVTNGGIEIIGPITYLTPDFYEKSAGIVSFTLTGAQSTKAAASPLAVVSHGSNQIQLREAGDGIWLRSDETVFRLNPGESVTSTFHATKFGQPAAGLTIRLGFDPTLLQGQTSPGSIPGPRNVGQPTSALSFPAAVTTGADGRATLTITASDPGTPRGYIDGQVYVLTYGHGATAPAVGDIQEPSRLLHFLVWSGYTIPATPTWTNDVRPILTQYANLYPVMKQFVDLSDFNDVSSKSVLVKQVLQMSPDQPGYMPVTRDLSANKKAMIIKWCDNPIE